jgi:hypothetical protein
MRGWDLRRKYLLFGMIVAVRSYLPQCVRARISQLSFKHIKVKVSDICMCTFSMHQYKVLWKKTSVSVHICKMHVSLFLVLVITELSLLTLCSLHGIEG